jgi:membrane AbrB-like protein
LVLCHAVRVLIVVFVIPLGFGFFGLLDPVIPATSVAPAAGPAGSGSLWHPDLSLQEAAILLVCAVLGSWGARRLRLPASFLLGPMVLSALVHISGLTASSPPQALVALAQVVIGAGIGARFSGISLRSVARTLTLSLGANVLLLGLALAFSWLGAELGGASLAANLLAIAPGGVAEMSLIALALGIDVAFVATSHLIRILLVVVAAPQAFRYWQRKR